MATLTAQVRHATAREEAAAIDRALRALGPVTYTIYAYQVGHGLLGIWLMKDGQFRPKIGKLLLGDCERMRGEFSGRTEYIASLALVGDESRWFRLTIGDLEVTALRAWFGDADEVVGE